jgi:hypothetical protein
MNSLWDIRIFLGLVPKESLCTKIYCGIFRFTLEVIIREIKDTQEKLPCAPHSNILIAIQVLTLQFCKR